MKYFVTFLLIIPTLLMADMRYVSDYLFPAFPIDGYKSFEMNDNGTIVYPAMIDDIAQIMIYKNGKSTQITKNESVYVGYAYLCINNNDQVAWLQTEYDDTGNYVNFNVWTASLTNEPILISNKISEWNNYCAYIDINDNGQVVWQQYAENTDTDIFLYSNGTTIDISQSDGEENFPKINNFGQVVFESWDPPASDWKTKIVLWDGTKTKTIAIDPELNCYLPIIEGKTVYYTKSSPNGSYIYGVNVDDNSNFKIDVEISSSSTPKGMASSYWLNNGRMILTSNDFKIYLYENETLTQLSENGVTSYNPFLVDNMMGWLFVDSDEKIKIKIFNNNKEYIIDESASILKIAKNGTVLFGFTYIYTLELYLSQLLDVYDVSGIVEDLYITKIKKNNDEIQSNKGLADVEVSSGKRKTMTDADGKFTLMNLQKGKHTITFFKEKYVFDPDKIEVNISDKHITLEEPISGLNPDGVEYSFDNSTYFCYPNPAKDFILIKLNENQNLISAEQKEIIVYDIYGNIVLVENITISAMNNKLDISKLDSGVYYFLIGNQLYNFIKIK